jgi:predicted dehydrogenase
METVRWGFIGLGGRGLWHLETLLQMERVEVTAVCATQPHQLKAAKEKIGDKQPHVAVDYYGGDGDQEAWRQLIHSDRVDAVVISTHWEAHAPMAIAAMEAGKHAFVEVPAAITVDECWGLVETSERTGRHCMMLENCNYGREELALLNMVRQGLFGELLHGEAAYIHDLRANMLGSGGTSGWRSWHLVKNRGNLYPTHGLGPIAHYMDVGRGDWMDYIVSMSTPARGRAAFVKEHMSPDHHWNKVEKWNCGDLNTSLIKLYSGRTIMVQWDETSPRPYSRHNYIQGTRGAFGGFPNRISVDYKIEDLPGKVHATAPKNDKGRFDTHQWDYNLDPWLEVFDHPLWKKVGKIAEEHGGHGGMDYIMLWRVQQCLLRGEPMDQSVYDAALWSVIMPLSEASVDNKGQPQKIPDFTRGKWKTTPPIPIFEG